jgi:AbiTii
MSLLREIQAVVASKDGDVTTALRKCKILAARLRSDELARWVDFELDGYPTSQPVPEYRQLSVSCYANFRNMAWSAQNQPLPRFAVPEEVAEAVFSPIEFRDGITVATAFAETGATIDVPALAVHVTQHRVLYPTMQCTNGWRSVSAPDFQQLISAVKNRILEFSLKIEMENPAAGEAPPNTQPVPPEKLQPLVQNVFYGNVGNIAQSSEHFTQTASIDVSLQDLGKLVTEFTNHLDELKLDQRQLQRAEAQLAIIKTELSGEPDATIVKQAGRSLRAITEGAISSLLATAAMQPTVWHWIHQTLAAFTT